MIAPAAIRIGYYLCYHYTTMSYKSFYPSAPGKLIWAIAMILGGLGIVGNLFLIEYISEMADWLLIVAFLLLVTGTLVRKN